MSVTSAPPSSRPRVFISYRRADTEASALLLYNELKARFGEDQICMDIFAIPGAVDYREYIERTLDSSALVLAVIGPNWVTATDERGRRLDDPDDVLRKELEFALERNVRMIPVLVQGAAMPRSSDIPKSLRSIVDRYPHAIHTSTYTSDIGNLLGMVDQILVQLIVDQAQGLIRDGRLEEARQAAAEVADEGVRTQLLAEIDQTRSPPSPQPRGETLPLRECLDAAGLKYHDFEEAFVIPFGGQRTDQVLVLARELNDGTTFLSVEFDAYKGRKKNKVALYQRLLGMSFLNYVKALMLADERFAFAAELPPGAATPEICDGLVRGLVALADVRDEEELLSGESWELRSGLLRVMQRSSFSVDEGQARAEVGAQLTAAGATPVEEGIYAFDLELGEGPRPLKLFADSGVISLIMPWPESPGGDLRKLGQLLELNRAVNVAKVGLDQQGQLRMLYETPRPVPDLVARLKEQFTVLVYGLILRR